MDNKQPPSRHVGDFAGCNWCRWVEERIAEQDSEIARLKRLVKK